MAALVALPDALLDAPLQRLEDVAIGLRAQCLPEDSRTAHVQTDTEVSRSSAVLQSSNVQHAQSVFVEVMSYSLHYALVSSCRYRNAVPVRSVTCVCRKNDLPYRIPQKKRAHKLHGLVNLGLVAQSALG